jgi:hypothetical protein
LNNFNKNSCIKLCCYDSIEFTQNGEKKIIECNFVDLDGIKKSKGLFKLAKELKAIDINAESKDKRYLLPNLRDILSHHIAFQTITKLEQLALDNNLKIIFVPKCHCE